MPRPADNAADVQSKIDAAWNRLIQSTKSGSAMVQRYGPDVSRWPAGAWTDGRKILDAAKAEAGQLLPPAPSPSPVPPGAVYFDGGFDTGDLSRWKDFHDANLPSSPPGVAVVASPIGPVARILCSGAYPSSSSTGDATELWVGDGSDTYDLPWMQEGASAWFLTRWLIPDGADPGYPGRFTPLVGAGYSSPWQIVSEWHENNGYFGVHGGGAQGSSYLGVWMNTVPRWFLRLVGGPAGAIRNYGFIETDKTQTAANNVLGGGVTLGTPQAIRFNHWYEHLVYVVWHHDPTVGYLEWWVDGNLRFADHLATLIQANDGTTPGVGWENGLYRGPGKTYVDTVYLGDAKVGSTRAAAA